MTSRRPESEIEDSDELATNLPGDALRRKSSEIREVSPVRVFVAKVLGVHTTERAWRRGADGEEEVARQLNKLGASWHVLHGVPVGPNETDIDHIVIGPAGVFTLNTKNHLGKRVTVYEYAIYVSGTKQPYLSKSRAEGKRSSKILSTACGFEVMVKPVVVIIASELVFKGSPKDVNVVGRRKVADWIGRRPSQLSTDQIESIYEVARRRSTWIP
jgi:hypothetical protein